MYHILYKDPMTGFVLESKGVTLTEAVDAITKAKDDLYNKGSVGDPIDQGYNQKETSTKVSGLSETNESEVEKNDSESIAIGSTDDDDSYSHPEDLLDLEDFWYPYGVYSW